MANGIGENPTRSPAFILSQVEFPISRDELVETTEDSEAPLEVINFMKCLPKEQYASQEECMRDFAEAERRMLGGKPDEPSRRENIGRGMEAAGKHP